MPDQVKTQTYHLLLTGNRNGRYKQIIGFAKVLDDDLTREVLAKKTWHRTNTGYAATNVRQPDGSYKRVLLHRLVYEHYHGPIPPGYEIDHRNRDKLCNLPANLRAVNRSTNARNKGITRKNKSGYVGVSWDKQRNLWIATIKMHGKQTYLGAFSDPQEAARRVNVAYRAHHTESPIPNPHAEPVPAAEAKLAESSGVGQPSLSLLLGTKNCTVRSKSPCNHEVKGDLRSEATKSLQGGSESPVSQA